jgi:hypothetical protein
MPERKANLVDEIFCDGKAIEFPSHGYIKSKKAPGVSGAFLLNGGYWRKVLQTKIG